MFFTCAFSVEVETFWLPEEEKEGAAKLVPWVVGTGGVEISARWGVGVSAWWGVGIWGQWVVGIWGLWVVGIWGQEPLEEGISGWVGGGVWVLG